MDASEIPITVAEKYLENLHKKILQQLERASTGKFKSRMQFLLPRVQERVKFLEQELQPSQKREQDGQKSSLIFDTASLSREEHSVVKNRLKDVLNDIKRQRLESHQDGLDPSLTLGYQEEAEGASHTVLDAVNLTEQEYDLVKERMRDLMGDVKKERGVVTQKANLVSFQEIQQQLQQQIEQEVREETEQKLHKDIQQDIEREINQGVLPEDQKAEDQKAEDQKAEKLKAEKLKAEKLKAEDQKEEGPLTFSMICEKISRGEALFLFDKVQLTEREQEMLQAFDGHIRQFKGVKQQQAFDLQHLTARSIRELEQIFKTYQPHGYLNVELHNVYNRLLTLRSRFSILLH